MNKESPPLPPAEILKQGWIFYGQQDQIVSPAVHTLLWGSFPMWWLPACPGDLYPKLITWEPQSNSSSCVVGFSPCRCAAGNVFSLNHENILRNALEKTINSSIQWELSDLLGFSFLWKSKLYTCWNKSGVCLQIPWPIYRTAWNFWPAGHRGLPGPQTLRSALACLSLQTRTSLQTRYFFLIFSLLSRTCYL